MVHEVDFSFQGKGGSRLTIELMDPASQHITPGPDMTPTEKKAVLKAENIGATAKPEVHNTGEGNKSYWLANTKGD
jgi:hypothetical protein